MNSGSVEQHQFFFSLVFLAFPFLLLLTSGSTSEARDTAIGTRTGDNPEPGELVVLDERLTLGVATSRNIGNPSVCNTDFLYDASNFSNIDVLRAPLPRKKPHMENFLSLINSRLRPSSQKILPTDFESP